MTIFHAPSPFIPFRLVGQGRGGGGSGPIAALFAAADSEFLSKDPNPFAGGAGVQYTFAGWVKFNTIGADRRGFFGQNNDVFSLVCRGDIEDAIYFDVRDSAGTYQILSSTFIPTTGVWYFVAGIVDANDIHVRINNNARVSSLGILVGGMLNAVGKFSLGQARGGQHDGLLDSWGVWSRPLSDSELDTLYNSGNGRAYSGLSGGLLTGLVSWWNLNETSGTRNDSHGSNHLTDNNTVTSGPGIAS